MTVNQLIDNIAHTLRNTFENPITRTQHAWWILEGITHKSRTQLLIQHKLSLSQGEEKTLAEWLDAIINHHKPIHYLIGSIPFHTLEIIVKPPILIPRPETEEWCSRLISQLQSIADQKLMILDIGTGSGCIALALAKTLPNAMIYATDISHTALALAQHNAYHNHVTNVTLIKSDLYNEIPTQLTFDLIVSNPPYIAYEEQETLAPSILAWEDSNALFAHNQGLALIKTIITGATTRLRKNNLFMKHRIPSLVIECGYQQTEIVAQYVHNTKCFHTITIHKDLFGNNRVITAMI